MKILVTGCAGFIGFHLCLKLIKSKKNHVFGIDNLNDYYDVRLKKDRIKLLKMEKNKNFYFTKLDISNKKKLINNFKKNKYDYVINLAAQAGVRHSITNPDSYLQSNIIGFYNVLEASNLITVKHLLFASTSSVYGESYKFPINEIDSTDKPLSFYAASKKSNEVMAYAYSNIFKLPITGMRFFTVYGEFGRPDMALFKFTRAILAGNKLLLNNSGNHIRDWTYIDDVVVSIEKLVLKKSSNKIPYDIFNICGSQPENLKSFLGIIETNLDKKANIKNMPMQDGDVHKTFGDSNKLQKKINFVPKINIKSGIKNFINWYLAYYK